MFKFYLNNFLSIFCTDAPPIRTFPLFGWRKPIKSYSKLDLPAPVRPTTDTHSPAFTLKEQFLSAGSRPSL
jgi:hypothetical protein